MATHQLIQITDSPKASRLHRVYWAHPGSSGSHSSTWQDQLRRLGNSAGSQHCSAVPRAVTTTFHSPDLVQQGPRAALLISLRKNAPVTRYLEIEVYVNVQGKRANLYNEATKWEKRSQSPLLTGLLNIHFKMSVRIGKNTEAIFSVQIHMCIYTHK